MFAGGELILRRSSLSLSSLRERGSYRSTAAGERERLRSLRSLPASIGQPPRSCEGSYATNLVIVRDRTSQCVHPDLSTRHGPRSNQRGIAPTSRGTRNKNPLARLEEGSTQTAEESAESARTRLFFLTHKPVCRSCRSIEIGGCLQIGEVRRLEIVWFTGREEDEGKDEKKCHIRLQKKEGER